MQRLLAVAFAMLMALELILLAAGLGLVAFLLEAMWRWNPWGTGFVGLLAVAGAVRYSAWRRTEAALSTQVPSLRQGVSVQPLPVSGVPAATYVVQFLLWALLVPVIGLLYGALIAGGVLLVPVVYFLHRPGSTSRWAAAAGVFGVLCGAIFTVFMSDQQLPFVALAGASVGAGIVGAAILLWRRSRRSGSITIKSYESQA